MDTVMDTNFFSYMKLLCLVFVLLWDGRGGALEEQGKYQKQ